MADPTGTTTLLAGLAEIMPESAVGPWLVEPNDAFDGLKPVELVERGESGRLWRMIHLLNSGSPF